jgi:hypothetical protein
MKRRPEGRGFYISSTMSPGAAMQPPTLTDLSVAELLWKAEIELQRIEKIVTTPPPVAKKQRMLQDDLLNVLKKLVQARFSASFHLTGLPDRRPSREHRRARRSRVQWHVIDSEQSTLTTTEAVRTSDEGVGGEFPIKRQSECEIDRDNVAAKHGDQASPEWVRIRRRTLTLPSGPLNLGFF